MVYDLGAITTADTSPHALVAVRTPAAWLQLVADPANVKPINIGGTTVTTSRGIPLVAGAGQMFPPIGDGSYIDLSLVRYAAQNAGDKLYVMYGRK